MNAVGAIRQIILDDAVTVALLANSTAVYPVVLPQTDVYPAVTLRVAGYRPNDTKTGTSSVDNVTVYISVFAKTYEACQNIDEAIRTAIDGFYGGIETSDSVIHYIDAVRFLNRDDDFDQESVLFVRNVSYDVRYKREEPPLPFGLPYVTQAQVWFDSLPIYSSDDDAIVDGMEAGQVYKTSASHVSLPFGVAKQIEGIAGNQSFSPTEHWFNSQAVYDSEEEADQNGVQSGGIYKTSSFHNQIAGGVLIQVQ